MPKEKRQRKAPEARRSFFSTNCASSSEESISSLESGEHAHIPIATEEINKLTVEFANQLSSQEQQHQENHEKEAMDELTAQIQQLTQQLTALSNKQAEQDSAVNQLRISNQARNLQVNNNNNDGGILQALSRIPDPIKGIPTFDGNRKQLNAWLNTAETTLARFEPLVTDEVYEIYVQAVFNKIEGHAKNTICLAGNPSTFAEVKTILIEALGDRQELSTYKARLWSNKQTSDMNIKMYYNKTKEIVQNIKAISKQDPTFSAHWDAIVKFINQDALAAFIAGLRAPYQGYAQASGPKDLEDAYAFLCKFQSTEKIAETHKQGNSYKTNNPNKNQNREMSYSKQKPTPPAEPMETKTTRSRLTINSNETTERESEENIPADPNSDVESDDDLDLNFHSVGTTQRIT